MANVSVPGVLGFDDFAFISPISGFSTRADEYDVSFTAFNQPVNVSLVSSNTTAFDPIVQIIDARSNAVITSDDDSGDGLNSLIQNFRPQGGVVYKIRVTSFNRLDTSVETPYTLQVNGQVGDITVSPRQSSFGNSQSGSIVTVSDVLDFNDYTFPSPAAGAPSLADEYELDVSAFNIPVQVSLISSTSSYDPLVQIINARTGVVVRQDDNSGDGLNSLIQNFRPQGGVDYRIRVTSFGSVTPTDPANYTLQASTTLGDVTLSPRVIDEPEPPITPDPDPEPPITPDPDPEPPTTSPPPLLSLLDTPFTRFQNTNVPGTYLFARPPETGNIRQNFPNFREEGLAFRVGIQANDELLEFTRFQNTNVPGTYLFAEATEAASIRQNFPNFKEEGVAFYALDSSKNLGTQLYRFQNTNVPGTYLFADSIERDSILANFPNFRLEGEAFEVLK